MKHVLRTYPYLIPEAIFCRRRIALLEEEMHSVCVTASLSGMPFSGRTSDSTGQAGILVEEREAILAEMRALADKAHALEQLHMEIGCVLRTLTREERLVICARRLGVHRLPWADLSRRLTPRRSIRWWQLVETTGLSRFKDFALQQKMFMLG
jgi:hypothetical protein